MKKKTTDEEKQALSAFYSSKEWQECRNSYHDYKQGLCELCLKDGIITAGEIVHHIEHLTPTNMYDASIALNFDNLMLVCRHHHGQLHRKPNERYYIDADGDVIPI